MTAFRVGDERRFAVRGNLHPIDTQEKEHWLFGNICFVAGSALVGNWDDTAALTVALASLPRLLSHRGNRFAPETATLSAEEAFARVYKPLFIDAGQSDEQVRRDADYYRRFVAVPAIDVFDNWMAFLFEDACYARYVWRDPENRICEVRLDPGEFDSVLDEFLNALESRTGQTRSLK